MAKKNVNSLSESIKTKMNTTFAAVIVAFTIFGFGYGSGTVVSNILHKIEINEINQALNLQLYNQKIDFDRKINEIIQENNILEIENGKLRKK